MFDLPVITKEERRSATQFRNTLLDLGFEMVQYSVYTKLCSGNDRVRVLTREVTHAFPHQGSVSIMAITAKQQENIVTLLGSEKKKPPQQRSQLQLF